MIRMYCICGATMSASSTPPATAAALAVEFGQRHTGDGHGPTTAAKAARARARDEQRLLRQEFA